MTAKPEASEEKPYDHRRRFIRALAEYLAGSQAKKSIELQVGKPSAEEWANLRGHTNLRGYPTVEEAYVQLCGFLGVEP